MTTHPPHPPHHPRLRPRGLQRRRLRRARQSQAAADHRPGAGRPAHDDDRRRQLAGRRRGPAGPGADGAHAPPRRALQHEIVNDHIHTADLRKRPFRLTGDSATTPATRSSSPPAPPRSTSACHPKRRIAAAASPPAPPATDSSSAASEVAVVGGGNTAVEEALYLSNIACTSRSCTAATSCAPRRSCRTGCSREVAGGQDVGHLEPRGRRGARAMTRGVTGVRLRATAGGASARSRGHRPLHRDRPHARTPPCSRASSTCTKAATSS